MYPVSCGSGGYTDPDVQEWMYAETWLHEDGFEERSLEDIKAYIYETREQILIAILLPQKKTQSMIFRD